MKELLKTKIALAGVLAIALALGAVPANAGPRLDTGKRDVIAEAETVCFFPLDSSNLATLQVDPTDEEILDFACVVLWKTDGDQIKGIGCPAEDDGKIDPVDSFVFVEYSGRNCDKNENALRRKMSSVVLSLEDVIDRGKANQVETAADYACNYAGKVDDLVGVGKLNQNPGSQNPNLIAEDLAADAEDIADALGFACE